MKNTRFMLYVVILTMLPALSVQANLIRTFNSYHAFFSYGYDANAANQDIFRNDAYAMGSTFQSMGWDTHVYGPGEAEGDLSDSLNDMLSYASPDELIFFYYSGHGGGYHGGGVDDTLNNGDESQSEDPLPPCVPSDRWDETFAYGVHGETILDDYFGFIIDQIQSQSAWVSGAIDSCHANGMLDGATDAQGFLGKESVWMTSVTEWQLAPICGQSGVFGSLVDLLLPTFDPLSGLDQLGDLWSWYWDAAEYGVANNLIAADQTLGIKIYEEDGSSEKYYIPEPGTFFLLSLGLMGLYISSITSIRRK